MQKKLCLILFIILLGTTFIGCGNLNDGEQEAARGASEKIGKKAGSYNLEKIDKKVAQANQTFAFDIFKKLNEEDSNNSIFISPFSISQALAMTYNGAEGTTKEAMEKTLGFMEIDPTVVNESYKNLNNYLGNVDKKITLNIGNSIWIKEGQVVNRDFISRNKDGFNAKVETMDFSDPKLVDTMNKWIKEATNGMIDKMIDPPIPEDTFMYLINAIYFKGDWKTEFDSKLTYRDDFKAIDGTVQIVNMMTKSHNSYEYTANDKIKAVRLPYGNGKTSMYILLPRPGIDINEYINELTIDEWRGIKKTLINTDDILFGLPKFKLEYGDKSLNNSLKSLGMEEAFERNADFSGICDEIYISDVIHKAVIEVNEKGTEAAAVTKVKMEDNAASEAITFIVDHPFLFIINDDVMDTILFMGKVVSIEE